MIDTTTTRHHFPRLHKIYINTFRCKFQFDQVAYIHNTMNIRFVYLKLCYFSCLIHGFFVFKPVSIWDLRKNILSSFSLSYSKGHMTKTVVGRNEDKRDSERLNFVEYSESQTSFLNLLRMRVSSGQDISCYEKKDLVSLLNLHLPQMSPSMVAETVLSIGSIQSNNNFNKGKLHHTESDILIKV